MNKQIYPLLIAQFLSAFADNAVLFTVIAIVMQSAHAEGWYIPAVQSAFTIAYVLLAPWAGEIADTHSKPRVLLVANLIKAAGVVLLFVNIEPIIAYSIVGIGAAIYNPVKYGILPELAEHNHLVKANSLMEGSTILAILLGMIAGAKVADVSTQWALMGSVGLFVLSALLTLILPTGIIKTAEKGSKIIAFVHEIKTLFKLPRSSFAIWGGCLFWLTAATLRVILIAWAPLILLSKNATEIAELTLFLAIGIIIGAAIVPKLIPLEKLRRARMPSYLMGVFIVVLGITDSIWPARISLLFIGMMGGMFIVPINALLQELGKKSIGSGRAVALQGFFNNLAMLVGVGTYTYATSLQADPMLSMIVLGKAVLVGTFLISIILRFHPDKTLEVVDETDVYEYDDDDDDDDDDDA
ncbi:MAG: lysophospholipid transporter LplT [Methylovulum sp.]|nr:lysophospholipid transporter LplT [Methylovulum sp.]MCF7998769.1 lysophospholipid transporter LplT [Methylovulum sp.]